MLQLLQLVQSYWLSLTTVVIIAISILSLYPADFLPAVAGSDKTHHFIAYAGLAFPVAIAKPKYWLLFIVGFWGYSGLIEIVQPFVNRHGEWLDLAANGLGLLSGILLAKFADWIFLNQTAE